MSGCIVAWVCCHMIPNPIPLGAFENGVGKQLAENCRNCIQTKNSLWDILIVQEQGFDNG